VSADGLSGSAVSADRRPDGNPRSPRNGTLIGSCPLDCPDGCSWLVTVEDGRAVRLRGNPDHPFTRGSLCPKVNPWLQIAAEPGRLHHPLRRVAPKGPGTPPHEAFVAITWDEALAEIATRFRHLIDTDGPATIWPYAGTGNVGFVQGGALPAGDRLWNHLGVSGHQISICSVSGHVGLGYTIGAAATFDLESLADAGTVILWGSNTLVANRHLWPFVEGARANGAPLVVIDPVRTRTASRADLHVAPRVGSDGALALGLCRAVVDAGLVDRHFVEHRTVGHRAFEASLDPWTPARTAEACGLTGAEFARLVEVVTDRAPLAIKLGQGVQRHAGGGQTARIISCLPALTGAYDRPGGGLSYSTAGPYGLNLAAAGGADLGSRPRHLAMTNLAANLAPPPDGPDDPPVRALFVHGANPVVSNPDVNGVRAGLSRPDLFTVVVEVFHTETTDYADLVLPSTLQHEQYEVNDSFAHLYVSLNRPAVDPPGQCLPHTEIFRRLARALDLREPALFASDRELAAALFDTPAYREAGLTIDVLEDRGWARLPGTGRPWRPLTDGFPTPSGRFEFASERAERDGHGLLPTHRPPSEAGRPPPLADGADRGDDGGDRDDRDESAYDLVAAASPFHVNSVFAGTDTVRRATGPPSLRVHPADAARDGIGDGAPVEVANERGAFVAVARHDRTVRPGVVAIDKGWWGMGVNATVVERDSDMGRGAVFHDNRVRLRPVGG
jgi:anaerobic selenocysteine-containing dehydrogenase